MSDLELRFYGALKEAVFYGKLIGVDTEGLGLEELERRFERLMNDCRDSFLEVSE